VNALSENESCKSGMNSHGDKQGMLGYVNLDDERLRIKTLQYFHHLWHY